MSNSWSGTIKCEIEMPTEPTPDAADSITYTVKPPPGGAGGTFTENTGEESSLVFHCDMNEDEEPEDISITDFAGLTDEKDSFTAEVPLLILGQVVYRTLEFTETNKKSNKFKAEFTFSGGTTTEEWKITRISNYTGSGEGSYIPYNVRAKGIKNTSEYRLEYEGTKFELEEEDGWFYLKGKSKANRTKSHQSENKDNATDIGTNTDGKIDKKDKTKGDKVKFEFIKQEGFAKIYELKHGEPYLVLISNFDNSDLKENGIEIDKIKWPSDNGFDYASDWKYYIKGNRLLVAVNDDYSERQKSGSEWIKDNLPASDGKHQIKPDSENEISLQDALLVIGGIIAKSGEKEVNVTFRWLIDNDKVFNVFFRIKDTEPWTLAVNGKDSTVKYKIGEELQIPVKIEGLTGDKTGKVSVYLVQGAFPRKNADAPLNLQIEKTCRVAYLAGHSDYLNKYAEDTLKKTKEDYESVSPKGRYMLNYILLNDKDEANDYALNYFPVRSTTDKFPSFWRQIVLCSHGGDPINSIPSNQKEFYKKRVNWCHETGDGASYGLYPWYRDAYWNGSIDVLGNRSFQSQNSVEFRKRFEGNDTSWYEDEASEHFGTYFKVGDEIQSGILHSNLKSSITLGSNVSSPDELVDPASDLTMILDCCYSRWAWRHPLKCPTNLHKVMLKKSEDCQSDSKFFDTVFKKEGNEYVPREGSSYSLKYGKLGVGEHIAEHRSITFYYTIPVHVAGYIKMFDKTK